MPVPSLNCLYYWFGQESEGQISNGESKFWKLHEKGFTENGFEIFLVPRFLSNKERFSNRFVNIVKRISGISVHIGDKKQIFLLENGIEKKIKILAEIMHMLNSKCIVIHASHFEKERNNIKSLFDTYLGGIEIWIENDGFQNEWGYLPENLMKIYEDFTEAKFVFDIAHVYEIKGLRNVNDYIESNVLFERLVEMHISKSNVNCVENYYEKYGFYEYKPFHALFSISGDVPDDNIMNKFRKIRKVIEGAIPKEDEDMYFLKKEFEIINKYD